MMEDVVKQIVQRQEEYLERIESIFGWISSDAARIISHTLSWQTNQGIYGSVMEIGTYYGKLFILLALSRSPGERAIGIDIFEDQHLNLDNSGCHCTQAHLEENLLRFTSLENISIIKSDSFTLGPDFIPEHQGVRWLSIDGSHTRLATMNDLFLAERLVRDRAIVAVDDIYRVDWQGVTAGVYEYLHGGGRLIPFAIIPNKLLLTTDRDIAREYKEDLSEVFSGYRESDGRQWQNFFGTDTILCLKDLDAR